MADRKPRVDEAGEAIAARVIVLGTDPEGPRGGIGVAMAGYLDALEQAGLLYRFHPTYRPDVRGRSWRTAVGALRPLMRSIRELHRLGRQPVVYAHAGQVVSIVRETSLLRVARRLGATTMLQLHSLLVESYLARPGRRRAFAALVRSVDRFCVLAPHWEAVLQRNGLGPTSIVPNPLPPWAESEARRPVAERTGGPLRALAMSRLVPGKGFDLAIDAMRHAPPGLELIIAGSGPEREALERRAAGLPVEFAGWVDGDEKQALLRSCDLFFLPSRHDSFGMGYVEAAAFGLPAVALRWGAIPDVVVHGQTGWLVDQPSPAALGEALARLADPVLRAEMARTAKRLAVARFGREQVGRALRRAVEAASPPSSGPRSGGDRSCAVGVGSGVGPTLGNG